MNKAERKRKEHFKYIKRCKAMGLDPDDPNIKKCYKKQGKPCSCYICSYQKYSRKKKHKNGEY